MHAVITNYWDAVHLTVGLGPSSLVSWTPSHFCLVLVYQGNDHSFPRIVVTLYVASAFIPPSFVWKQWKQWKSDGLYGGFIRQEL